MKQNRPKVIVITGGIGTGKSTAVNIIRSCGFTVLDSDKIVHEGYNTGSSLYFKMINHFGEEILDSDYEIDRQRLGKIVFSDENMLNELNDVVHGYVYDKLKEGIENCLDSVIFLDIPLILETKHIHEPIYDEIWLVYVPENIQRKRLKERAISENKNPEDVLKIIDKQIPIEEKVIMADEVINNEGTVEELRQNIKNIIEIKGIGWWVMARRKRVYSKKRRINYKRIVILVLAIIIIVFLAAKVFKRNSYISKVEEALNSEISMISGSLSTVTKIDATVYENDGIKYTNQHEGIKNKVTYDGSLSEDIDKVSDAKILFENLLKSEKTEVVGELPAKDDGYLWLEADIISESKVLLFNVENEYNFDLYYDIENKTVYIKEKYYDEFSNKYNKTKFQGYKATDEFISIIEGAINVSCNSEAWQGIL